MKFLCCDMRAWGSIFFVFLYSIALLKPAQPFLEYYANYDYFATVLCINKDKPETGCNGQCELSKRLKASQQESSQPESPSSPGTSLKDYPIGFVHVWQLQVMLINHPINYPAGLRVADVRTGFTEIFHPPA